MEEQNAIQEPLESKEKANMMTIQCPSCFVSLYYDADNKEISNKCFCHACEYLFCVLCKQADHSTSECGDASVIQVGLTLFDFVQ